MKRFGWVAKVRPEQYEAYKRLHADVWPDVLKRIKACHLRTRTAAVGVPHLSPAPKGVQRRTRTPKGSNDNRDKRKPSHRRASVAPGARGEAGFPQIHPDFRLRLRLRRDKSSGFICGL